MKPVLKKFGIGACSTVDSGKCREDEPNKTRYRKLNGLFRFKMDSKKFANSRTNLYHIKHQIPDKERMNVFEASTNFPEDVIVTIISILNDRA